MMTLKKILVPIDFSKESELALKWAVKLASDENEPIIYLLHILTDPPVIPDPIYWENWGESAITREWDHAQDELEKWQKKIPPTITSVSFCQSGDRIEGICSVSRREDIDLIVMTTHGRQGLSRLTHPNMTENVVRLAPCPVMVLHLSQKMQEMMKMAV